MLKLADTAPIASGTHRDIYACPGDPTLLIKIMRPDVVARRWGTGAPWYRQLKRARQYASHLREIKEYLAVRAAHPAGDPPIVRIAGLVDTDRGLGLVVEKVSADDGGLAPTLAALIETGGCPPALERDLDTLIAGILRHNVIVGDLHPWNIVRGSDSRGGPRLVLIDGFGERNVIPRCSMSARFNRWHSRRLYDRLVLRVRELAAARAGETAAR